MGTPRWMRLALGVPLVCLLMACVTLMRPAEPHHRTASIADVEAIGADECTVCHEDVGGHAPAPDYHGDCEACHGGGSLHADDEEVESIRFPGDADCLDCHGAGPTTHLAWTTSEHQRTGVLCSDCHDLHNREPKHVRVASLVGPRLDDARVTTRLCVSCHAEIGSRLDFPSHHPIQEGMLECADCHKPHENRRVTLGARTELCTGCHEDHAGPWIYEHAPVAEDCGLCHTPHGAASYNLLETSQPGSCISCHSLPSISTHDPTAMLTRCTDCHGAIHGSYADPHLRR